jgi:hypothetical protein
MKLSAAQMIANMASEITETERGLHDIMMKLTLPNSNYTFCKSSNNKINAINDLIDKLQARKDKDE